MIAITKYADRLLEDLKTVDYLPKIKKQQEDWIGKSEGAEIDFVIDGSTEKLTVFTTRPDTLFGVTYVVLAPEHPLAQKIVTDAYRSHLVEYVLSAKAKTDIERGDDSRIKTGVFTGAFVVNPVNGEKVPVWVADYVLAGYGTGAVMAVPAHDERDFAFAEKYELPIKSVVIPSLIDASNPPQVGKENTLRDMVLAIVHDPRANKYLVLKWPKQGWTTFVTGGVEAGEDRVLAAKREIAEETGYTNVRLVRSLGMTEAFFFAAHKDVNRQSQAEHFLFELVDDTRQEVATEERDQHEVAWLSPAELKRTPMQHAEFGLLMERIETGKSVFTETGVLVGSGDFDGSTSDEAKGKIVKWLEKQGTGRAKTTYRLRDWVFSRQRYWGEPIPLVYCEKDKWVAVPDVQLPVELPQVEKYEPTDNGESPLSAIDSFVNTTCPTCGGPAKRETDTMPNWAGSSWYFLRYMDPHNDEAFASKKALKYWTPVDLYNGGMEHTTLHLLYSRFWNKFLFDQGFVPTSEPYARRHSHGLIMSEDGTKMSKSKGNVVNPDEVVAEFGADAFRTYILFMGPFEEHVPWSTNGLVGVRRFLDKVERLAEKLGDESAEVTKALHKTIQKVSDNIDGFRFNTAVSELMKFVNIAQESGSMSEKGFAMFLTLLSPFAPHLSNELWEKLGLNGLVEEQAWPVADAKLLVDDEIKIVIQVNGKLRGNLVVPADIADTELIELAKADENVKKFLVGEIKKEIVVKGKLVNFVV